MFSHSLLVTLKRMQTYTTTEELVKDDDALQREQRMEKWKNGKMEVHSTSKKSMCLLHAFPAFDQTITRFLKDYNYIKQTNDPYSLKIY